MQVVSEHGLSQPVYATYKVGSIDFTRCWLNTAKLNINLNYPSICSEALQASVPY